MIPKKQLNKLIQQFYDEMVNSEEFQNLITEYTVEEGSTGVRSEKTLEEAFKYLDIKCQEKLKEYIDKQEAKLAKRNAK